MKRQTSKAGSCVYIYLPWPQTLSQHFHLSLVKTHNMGTSLLTLCLILVSLTSSALSATPRRPVDVPFGRNYVPTWAFDHIKYFNGGSAIQLHLDKYTGT